MKITVFNRIIQIQLLLHILNLVRSQTTIVADTFNQLTEQTNAANSDSYWEKNPPFTTGLISYQCLKDAQWQPEMLLIKPNETLTKVVNALSLSHNIYFYSFSVSMKLLLIDMQRDGFVFTLTFENNDINFPLTGNVGYTSSTVEDYCYEMIYEGNPCEDYCFGTKYDSIVNISQQYVTYSDTIILSMSSNAQLDQQVGIVEFQLSVNECDPNCLKCSQSATSCIQCPTTVEYIDFNSRNCVTSCQPGQYSTTDTTLPLQQVCKQCTFANCKECISTQCTLCNDGYYYDGTQCTKCSNICSTCVNSATQCLICSNGYYLSQTLNDCVSCPTGCSSCSSLTYCSACKNGYYLAPVDSQNSQCLPCFAHCKNCNDSTSCQNCSNSYSLKVSIPSMTYYDQCVQDCGSGQFKSNDSTNCILFGNSNCINPDPSTGCQNNNCQLPQYSNFQRECVSQCQNGYYQDFKDNTLTYTSCYQCPQGSQLCLSPTFSTKCQDGYYLDINGSIQTCLPCESNCANCVNGTSCTKCSQNYSLDGSVCVTQCSGRQYSQNQVCHDCGISNCSQCQSANQCAQCQGSTYDLINGNCYIQCQDHYFRDKKTLSCMSCGQNCLHCNSLTWCLQCDSGYYGVKQCNLCDSSCQECSGPSTQECTSCNASKGLFLFQNSCLNICPTGYMRNSSTTPCIPCNDTNCKNCDSGVNTCQSCKNPQNFILDNTSCVGSCPNDHQSYIRNSVNYCLKLSCSTGFYQSQDTCLEICGDGKNFGSYQCDDGNNINGDGCNSNCQIENLFQCVQEPNNGKSDCYFILNYQAQTTQNTNEILLQFNTGISITNKFLNKIQILIEGVEKSSYSISQDIPLNNSQLFIKFKFNIQVAKVLQIQLTNDFLSDINLLKLTDYPIAAFQLQKSSTTLSLTSSYEPQESQKQAAEGVSTATQVVSTIIISSTIPLTFAGGITLVASIVDISQIIRCHKYIDIIYPINLEEFFTVFEEFSFPFITNFFEFFIPEHYEKPSYESFERNDLQAFYIKNAGQHYSLVGLTMIIHLILKLISIKYKKLAVFVDKTFIYAVYHEVVMSVYLEIVFNTFVQWTNMSTSEPIDYVNQIVMFLTFSALLPVPLIAAYMMKKYQKKLEDEQIKSKFGCLYEGLRDDYLCLIYYVILHLRKVIFSLTIVFLNSVTFVQCSFLILTPLCLLAYIILKKPFIHKSENVKQIIQELCLSIGSILILVLKTMDGELEEKRIQMSWAVIVFFSIIILMHFFFSMYEVYHLILKKPSMFLYQLILSQCQKLGNTSKSKVAPQKPTVSQIKQDFIDIVSQKSTSSSKNKALEPLTSLRNISSQVRLYESPTSSFDINTQDQVSIQEKISKQNNYQNQQSGILLNLIQCQQETNQMSSARLQGEESPEQENNPQINIQEQQQQIGRRVPRGKTVKFNNQNGNSPTTGWKRSTTNKNLTVINQRPNPINQSSSIMNKNVQDSINNQLDNSSQSPTLLKVKSRFYDDPAVTFNDFQDINDAGDSPKSQQIQSPKSQNNDEPIKAIDQKSGRLNTQISKLRRKTQKESTLISNQN